MRNLCQTYHLSPAIIVLGWDYLMYSQDVLFRYFFSASLNDAQSSWYQYGLDILLCIAFLSFVFLGLLADIWIGRYKAIIIGAALCFLSWIAGGIGFFILNVDEDRKQLVLIAYGVSYFFGVSGYASFGVNIIQYNIDQLVGASANKLSSYIHWHIASIPFVCIVTEIIRCTIKLEQFELVAFLGSGISVSLVLVSNTFLKHKLENLSLIKNPIKLIIRVLCYARKHKYPENRSALTYWEEEAPSRLDLGKEKYGGPFTEEEVEDVKTTLRLLPLFISLIGFACCDDFKNFFNNSQRQITSLTSCLILTELAYYVTSGTALLVYLIIMKTFFSKYIPSMMKRISLGLIFCVIVSFSKLIVFSRGHDVDIVLLIPQVLLGISFTLVIPASLELTIAQSPVHMRGVMVGLWYASLGAGYLVRNGIKLLFHHVSTGHIDSNHIIFIIDGSLILAILTGYILLAKAYKYRVRENEVNIVQIVDQYYQKYVEHENDLFTENVYSISDV